MGCAWGSSGHCPGWCICCLRGQSVWPTPRGGRALVAAWPWWPPGLAPHRPGEASVGGRRPSTAPSAASSRPQTGATARDEILWAQANRPIKGWGFLTFALYSSEHKRPCTTFVAKSRTWIYLTPRGFKCSSIGNLIYKKFRQFRPWPCKTFNIAPCQNNNPTKLKWCHLHVHAE